MNTTKPRSITCRSARALRAVVAILSLLLATDAATQPRQGWGLGEMPSSNTTDSAAQGLVPDASIAKALAQPAFPMKDYVSVCFSYFSTIHWAPHPGGVDVYAQSEFYRGDLCQSGKANLFMTQNGWLSVYDEYGRELRRYGTREGAVAVFQHDGNFVIYRNDGHPIWASNTWGNPGAVLVVQNDGNIVIYRSDGYPLWATNTAH